MKIFLDDIRNPLDQTWTIVRNFNDCIYLLSNFVCDVISLDHDLGTEKTGYDVAKWIEERVYLEDMAGFEAPKIMIHSANPVGRKNIEACIESIIRFKKEA